MTSGNDPIGPEFERAEQALPLPGMEPAPASIPPLVRALRRTVADLDRSGVVAERDAVDLAAMVLLARSAEMKLATGRGSTIANDVELLLRTKRELIGEVGDEKSMDQNLLESMAKWTAAAEAELAREREAGSP